MNRRFLMTGAASLVVAAPFVRPAHAVERAFRKFRILRSGDDIGSHSLSATMDDNGFRIEIKIDIRVKILGITAYRYALLNSEQWEDGQIVAVNSRVNDDGDDAFCKITRQDGGLVVSGSTYSGPIDDDAVTTSYYHMDFLNRRPWISTQSGKPLEIDVAAAAAGWNVTGELETTLLYDDRGEWMGSEFDAGGEPARYELVSETGLIAPLWSAA